MTVTLIVRDPWSPLQRWLSTAEGRENLALFLAARKSTQFDPQREEAMDGFIASILALLAPHLDPEEQWAVFEGLVVATRQRGAAFTSDQTDAACAAADDAIRRLCGGA